MFASVIKPIILHKFGSLHKKAMSDEGITECVRLAEALPGIVVKASFTVNLRKPDPGQLLGDGKVKQLYTFFSEMKISLTIIDGVLTPVQQRNLERLWGVKVIDRTALILEIFGARAMSREGVLQVELAHLNYQKSRLVRSWTHLERQRGGAGFLGGPGETQIEADKRAINARISQIKQALTKVVRTRNLHRIARKKIPYPTVALVGYTNAGKSSVFNRLTKGSNIVKDMLFATLDPKMNNIQLSKGKKIIVSDTVGFVSNLPTHLVAAFRATLEEVTTADLILHVRDVSSTNFEAQGQAVNAVLKTLGVEIHDRDIIEIWNKVDKLVDCKKQYITLDTGIIDERRVVVSATTGKGFEELLTLIETFFKDQTEQEEIFVPFSESKSRSWLYRNNLVIEEKVDSSGSNILVEWTKVQKKRFKADCVYGASN